MRRILTALALSTTLTAGVAAAQTTVVELYTSQGCSSCPPADEMLTELAARNDVIALSLHVDYWDYLGWVDDLADPSYTARQQAFAAAAGSATVYTPQMVIGGQDHVIGSRPMQVMDQVLAHGARPDPVAVSLNRSGNTLQIKAHANGNLRKDTVVQIVRYTPRVVRNIRRGENAGKSILYTNVVNNWSAASRWNTASPLAINATVSGNDPVVVIVQEGTNGPILGAAQLR